MTSISRAFGGRRRDEVDPSGIPPGRCYERGLPVLSAGTTPRTPVEEWMFSIHGAVDEARSWTWDEFTALPTEEVTVDIHCVTKLSNLDTRWKDVPVDTLLDGGEDGGRLDDRDRRRRPHDEHGARGRDRRPAWTAYEYYGTPPEAKHRGPARLLVPHLLRLEEREVVPWSRSRARLPRPRQRGQGPSRLTRR